MSHLVHLIRSRFNHYYIEDNHSMTKLLFSRSFGAMGIRLYPLQETVFFVVSAIALGTYIVTQTLLMGAYN